MDLAVTIYCFVYQERVTFLMSNDKLKNKNKKNPFIYNLMNLLDDSIINKSSNIIKIIKYNNKIKSLIIFELLRLKFVKIESYFLIWNISLMY